MNKHNDENEIKNIKEIEITCEIFEKIGDIISTLESRGFKYIEEFILNDIYMKNDKTNECTPKNGKITDTLIIRYVNENDKKVIYKKRNYNNEGIETSTEKSIYKIDNIKDTEKQLNALGYTRFLNMIDKNYKYENETLIVYIQEVKDLGTFLEVEIKQAENEDQDIQNLIEFVNTLGLNIEIKFDIRKAELLYKKQNNID